MPKHPGPDPPEYPRCATCKHWKAFSPISQEDRYGNCEEVTGGRLVLPADFGCVLHSDLAKHVVTIEGTGIEFGEFDTKEEAEAHIKKMREPRPIQRIVDEEGAE